MIIKNKLKCFIIDDEKRAINSLEFLLDYYCNEIAEVIGSASNYEEAIAFLNESTINVIFLDIKLGDRNGFEILEHIGAHENIEVIMVTAYSEYALEAFKYNAINYLLKPVDPEQLQRTISKINERINIGPSLAVANFLKTQQERIFFPTRDGYDSLRYKEIIYIKGDGSYAIVHTTNNKQITVSKNLSFFENLLEKQPDFVRIHKSYIINKTHIQKIDKHGGLKLVLTNDTDIPVSPTMKNMVMDFIGF